MHQIRCLGVVMSVAWAMMGCAAGAGARAVKGGPEFPSQASLNELAARPSTSDQPEERKTLAVDDWQPAAEAAPPTDAEALAKGVAQAHGREVVLEAELDCAAREVARFYGAHGAFPDQQLQAYMAGVCGVSQSTFGLMVWSTPNDSVASVERQKEWHAAIAKQLGEWLPENTKEMGAAQLSDGKNSLFAATVAQSQVTWEARRPVVNADGVVELSGTVRMPAQLVYGLSNVGAYGVRHCHSDPRVAAPRFHLTCRLDPADNAAWVDIQALPPGHVLTRGVARVLLRRDGATLAFSSATKNVAPESVSSPAQFASRLLALVNETRRAAQMPALQLATHESETSLRLAPHYFESEAKAADVNDRIALGLMAGWDVSQGTIRSGDFYSAALSGSLDPKRWLGFMLEQPAARRVLLDPEARSIAIGPDVRPQSQHVGALISTYAFYESDDHRSDVQHFLSRLDAQRRDLGLPPAKVTPAPEMAGAVRDVKKSHDPAEALHNAMEEVVSRSSHGVEGLYIEATDLDHVTFPDALLRPSVTIAVSAAHHRYPKAAWGTLVLVVVVLDSTFPQKVAGRAPVQQTE